MVNKNKIIKMYKKEQIVTVRDLKKYLRINGKQFDLHLMMLRDCAIEQIEQYISVSLLNNEYELNCAYELNQDTLITRLSYNAQTQLLGAPKLINDEDKEVILTSDSYSLVDTKDGAFIKIDRKKNIEQLDKARKWNLCVRYSNGLCVDRTTMDSTIITAIVLMTEQMFQGSDSSSIVFNDQIKNLLNGYRTRSIAP